MHYGGGGFDGSLVSADGLRTPVVGIKSEDTPLERGYATFGSDSGHHHHYLYPIPDVYNEVKSRFALNDEQRHNYAKDGLKKTHDAAVAVIRQYYGTAPKRMFFLGGSTGGREAYFVTQLWPNDYDGVLGAYAGWNQVELDLQLIRVTQAEYRHGDKLTRGWLPKDKTRLVAQRVMDACDAADGVKDGIISNPAACQFDPKTLACPAGKNAKDCLTPGQIETFETFATEQKTDQTLEHGVDFIPGYNVLRGTDLTGSMGLLAASVSRSAVSAGVVLLPDRVGRAEVLSDEEPGLQPVYLQHDDGWGVCEGPAAAVDCFGCVGRGPDPVCEVWGQVPDGAWDGGCDDSHGFDR